MRGRSRTPSPRPPVSAARTPDYSHTCSVLHRVAASLLSVLLCGLAQGLSFEPRGGASVDALQACERRSVRALPRPMAKRECCNWPTRSCLALCHNRHGRLACASSCLGHLGPGGLRRALGGACRLQGASCRDSSRMRAPLGSLRHAVLDTMGVVSVSRCERGNPCSFVVGANTNNENKHRNHADHHNRKRRDTTSKKARHLRTQLPHVPSYYSYTDSAALHGIGSQGRARSRFCVALSG